MGFDAQMIKNILRLIVAVLYAGNMTFTETTSLKGDTCTLDETEAAEAVACLLGVSFDKLAAALTSRVLFLKEEVIVKELNAKQAYKASEALIKSIYGANFDYIVKTINESIHNEKIDKRNDKSAYVSTYLELCICIVPRSSNSSLCCRNNRSACLIFLVLRPLK